MTDSTTSAFQKGLDASQVEYAQVGTSGLRVSVPILGAMSFGSSKWAPWVLDEDESVELLKAAYDRGINTWDTADMYSNGLSEEVVGKAIKKYDIPREKLVLLTKCALGVGEQPDVHIAHMGDVPGKHKDYVNRTGLSRGAIFKSVDAALKRLGTDYIDLFQIHRFDATVPVEETMRALHDLVQVGKIRYIGASSMWATQFAQMQFVAERNGWTKFVSMQNFWNLVYREEEREMIRFCKQTGVGILPWSPLYGGKLARPLGDYDSVRSSGQGLANPTLTPVDEQIVRRVEEIAKKKGWSMSHVALGWLVSKGAIPITGFNSLKRIDEACELRGKTLTEEEAKYLEEPYVPRDVIGHF
ncbi:Aldo-keto reductase AMT2 [Colletotrichum sidae]|uniref:Aldo-keto reductase AMT2 n=1 Tax=Colletotrichum sidae TaxID=1347389 RepID=A0A4R8SM85_9PEZI|nr:Aldo-keto reductase AMT2 [Colletotrichum sidae]